MRRSQAVTFLAHSVYWAAAGCGSGAGATFGDGSNKQIAAESRSGDAEARGSAIGNETSEGGQQGRAAAPAQPETSEEPADRPTWVNGSWLTCAWGDATATEVAIRCALDPVVPAVAWTVVAGDGGRIGPVASGVFVLEPTQIPDAVVVVSAPDGAGSLERPLEEVLPGFDDDGALASCLLDGGDPRACLESAGVTPAQPSAVGQQPPPTEASPSPAPQAPAPAPQASAPAPQAPAPMPAPTIGNPVVLDGVVFYRGVEGASCAEVCVAHGGTRDETISLIGSGGASQSCVGVSSGWGYTLVYDNYASEVGLGCYVAPDGEAKRVVDPATTQDAKAPGASRICACAK